MRDHLLPEELLALLDGELPGAEEHLETCAGCREQMEAIRSGLQDYLAWHERIQPLAPVPPAPWQDLSRGMDAIDSRRALRTVLAPRRKRVWWMVAAAAAVLVLAYAGYHQLPSVQAAELLEKAVAAEPPARPGASIRVYTRRRDFVRPRVQKSGAADDSELMPLFAAAGFDWAAPFGARPFADWRGRLSDKHDVVEYQGAVCLIRTSSDSNALAQATLVLRASDLEPVMETLQFRENETVEISTASPAQSEPAGAGPEPVPAATPHAAGSAVPRVPAAVRMLHLVAALHAIHADLGLVEIQQEGEKLVLRGNGLSAARRDEIRQAVAGIDEVDLAFGDDRGMPSSAPSAELRRQSQKPEGPAPLRALLESKLPEGSSVEDAVNQILDTSDGMMSLAFGLRMLARRYPPEEERQLAAADRDLLMRLRGIYVGELKARTGQLGGLLSPLFSAAALQDTASATWQMDAERAFLTVQALDSTLSEMLAGPSRNATPESELLRQVEDAWRRAQAVRVLE